MTTNTTGGNFLPFGLPACEDELKLGNNGNSYRELYLKDTPFHDQASNVHTYLIVGRRGAGKTALAQAFRFSSEFQNPHFIFIRPEDYHDVLDKARYQIDRVGDVDLWRMTQIWEQAIWSLIASCLEGASDTSSQMSLILRGIMAVLTDGGDEKLRTPDG